MSLEQYMQDATKEFTMQHFQTFYLDVIHRGYTLKQYLDEDNLLDDHVTDMGVHDFVILRDLLNISRKEAISMDRAGMGDKIRKDFREKIESTFTELLQGKNESIKEDLQEELTDKERDRLGKQQRNIEKALEA